MDELTVILEELGDCMEDMARAVDRMRAINKRMFRAVQELSRTTNELKGRVQRLEDTNAAERLEEEPS